MLEIQRLSSQMREARICENLMGVVITEDKEIHEKRHIRYMRRDTRYSKNGKKDTYTNERMITMSIIQDNTGIL